MPVPTAETKDKGLFDNRERKNVPIGTIATFKISLYRNFLSQDQATALKDRITQGKTPDINTVLQSTDLHVMVPKGTTAKVVARQGGLFALEIISCSDTQLIGRVFFVTSINTLIDTYNFTLTN